MLFLIMTDGFTGIALQLLRDAKFRKKIEGVTHAGLMGEVGAGDYVLFELYAPEGSIIKIGYQCNGCPTTMACSEIACQLVLGKSLAAIDEITVPVIDSILGHAAEGKEGISKFVMGALRSVQIVGKFKSERVNA